MSNKTGKVVYLKQAKEKKLRSKVKDIAGKMIPSIKLQKVVVHKKKSMNYIVNSQGSWSQDKNRYLETRNLIPI